jgi:response regulator RpfG family c-di-GMP phosphodiesterase
VNPALSFLLVDDEEAIVVSLRHLVEKLFPGAPISTALDGQEAWDILQKRTPSVVISDLSMPGLSGLELCKKTKAHSTLASTYFIILTAFSSKEQRVLALENGADDFLAKPIAADELLARLRSAARIVHLQLQLQDENRKLRLLNEHLRQDLEDMMQMAVAFLNSRIPESKDILQRVRKASVWIAKKFEEFSEAEIETIRIAANICLIGKLYLPDSLIHQPVSIDGKATDDLMYQVPLNAQQLLETGERLRKTGVVLRHIFENYDGSGFPDHLQTREIPLASRIIRVALDFEEYRLRSSSTVLEALERVKRESKRLYDPRFVALLDEYVWAMSPEIVNLHATPVQIYELKAGMEIVRDVVSASGLKIIPAGTVLQERTIERLISYTTTDPLLGSIYVRKQ